MPARCLAVVVLAVTAAAGFNVSGGCYTEDTPGLYILPPFVTFLQHSQAYTVQSRPKPDRYGRPTGDGCPTSCVIEGSIGQRINVTYDTRTFEKPIFSRS